MSVDAVLEGYIHDFVEEQDLNIDDKSLSFEHFVNYCIVARQYPKDFEYSQIHTGGSGDCSIDGAAIIINNKIVTSPEQVEQIIKADGELDVSFIFIQSKTSRKFKGADVGQFIYGVENVFSDEALINESENIEEIRAIKEKLYNNSIHFVENPKLELFYATQGEWLEPQDIAGRADKAKNNFMQSNNFSSCEVFFIDASKIKSIYKELKRKVVKEIHYENRVPLPEIDMVRQSYIGSMSVEEYINLITDSDGNLQKNLFEDNVRDYQGRNKVNRSIENTITNKDFQAALPVLHNGVTIVAQKAEQIGRKMKLTDFQIVNGCQSSHVLYNLRDKIQPDTHIVVKVIETKDYDFATNVVRAANQQTEVKDEAFESLSSFHKNLEEFYLSKSKKFESPIYYERRSKQYDGAAHVKPFQVVNLSSQISAYVAGVLAQPQSTHRYYGELLKSNSDKLFQKDHKLEVYYILALISKKVDKYFRQSKENIKYKSFRYHLLMILYRYYNELISTNRKKFDYDYVINDLYADGKFIDVLEIGVKIIETCLRSTKMNKRNAVRSKIFTGELLNKISKDFKQER